LRFSYPICDTLAAFKNSASDGSVILAKNSNGAPNEGHGLLFFPQKKDGPDTEKVKSSYIEIPQVRETCAVVLDAPDWMFGHGMRAIVAQAQTHSRQPFV
jgi:dipeptidase